MPAVRSAERVRLGRRGPVVSRLGVGTSPFGGVFGRFDASAAIGAVHAALEAGVTYFDTAPAYGATGSERVLGEALARGRGLAFLDEVLETFGPGRCMVGSDWPVCTARSWHRLGTAGGGDA